ncbi:MAG: sulfurtransferase-like selenium metabolism protein YedF [Synergistaceae bacterium]|nr:sulfurtransferase-like selenium metabolism protein YedF [Synergistaceae bacterium]
MKTIDARGKACPEPVTLAKACVDQGEKELEVLLDNPVSASNVRRFLESKGFGVQLKDDDGLLTVSASQKSEHLKTPKKTAEQDLLQQPQPQQTQLQQTQPQAKTQLQTTTPLQIPPGEKQEASQLLPASSVLSSALSSKRTFSVLITCQNLGQSDQQLGDVLMKSFLGTLSQLDDAPLAVALMNEGVKLALYDSSSCDHLKNLEKRGTLILACGTCVSHFHIAEQIGIGTISNMFEILETLNKADKIMTL